MGRPRQRRAIGIVRVSRVKGREGESFASPGEQRERIERACERDGLTLLQVIEELDVSGGTTLAKRAGLREAVEAVEAGQAEVVVAAYFDRLVRSLAVQREVVERVESAGGHVLAVDVGRVTEESAGQWLSGTMLGAVAEYQRRTTAERAREAQRIAVGRGVAPWPRVPPGYERGVDGILVESAAAPAVRQAFALRATGGTWQEIRDLLAAAGVRRTYHGVQAMLRSRVYLGEIHFGDLVNLRAHEPLIDRDLWRQAQRVRSAPGPRPRSERLLARLGVLRCATCDARMVVGTAHGGRYWLYRCPPNGECDRRVTVSADLVERVVVERVVAALEGIEGRAAVESNAREAEAAAERAQADLDSALRAFGGLEDEPAAIERLAELRAARDAAVERLDHLGDHRSVVVVSAAEWEGLTLDERRALVRAVVERVTVAPGRGESRIGVELRV